MRLFFLFLLSFFLTSSSNVYASINLSISNLQKTDDYYSLDAVVSGIASSSACYVQAMFTAPGDPHYFGFTWSSTGSWFNYVSSPSPDFIKANFIKLENDKSVKILVKPDFSDPDYKGQGDYLLKLRRYTGGSSSSAGESNSLTINLSEPTHSPTSTDAINRVSTTPAILSASTSASPLSITPTTSTDAINRVSTSTSPPSNQPNLFFVGAGLVITGISGLLYRFRHLLKKAVK